MPPCNNEAGLDYSPTDHSMVFCQWSSNYAPQREADLSLVLLPNIVCLP
jgi:hypothetical protein